MWIVLLFIACMYFEQVSRRLKEFFGGTEIEQHMFRS